MPNPKQNDSNDRITQIFSTIVVWIFLGAILLSLLASTCLISCINSVRITTPEADATKIQRAFKQCKSAKDVDKAADLWRAYVDAYQEAAYEGKITAEDVKDFVMKAGYNEYQIEAEKAYFLNGLND